MINFHSLGLNESLIKAVDGLGFINPTPVQEKVIPLLLEQTCDIMALAQTGTGKTAAYGLPLLQRLIPGTQHPQVLVLSPTRELCVQITNDLKSYAKFLSDISIVPVYGGVSIENQMREIKSGVQVVVATPGRMNDIINRKKIKLNEVQIVILDEADEMLNMGFREEIDTILENVPSERQTWLFSATMPNEVREISKKYMNSPIEVVCGRKNAGAETVSHFCYMVHEKDRYLASKRVLDVNPDIYGILFCRTRHETQEIATKLMADGYNADALHGDLSQAQRDHVMNKFRTRNLQILVATDVAARGLDVDDLTHIINYHMPEDTEIYTHRSGRTGRAGKLGVSIVILNLKEKYKLRQIENLIGKKFELKKIPTGAEVCKQQLLKLIDKVEKVEVDHQQIDPLLPGIMQKLESFDRDELVKRFVSLEFNRFFEYYKNSPDLNISEDDTYRKRDKDQPYRSGDRSDRYDRGRDRSSDRSRERSSDRSRDRSPERGRDRDSDRGRERSREKGASRDQSKKFTRFFINIGKGDGVTPPSLIGLVNDITHSRKIAIGKIDLMPKHSYFEADSEFTDKILKSFKKLTIEGRAITVKVEKDERG